MLLLDSFPLCFAPVGLAVVLVIRLLVPLTILRWPLPGALLAIAADTSDILIFNFLGFPSFGSYQEIDKALDVYYLGLEMLVALRWELTPRLVAGALFSFRMVGVLAYEITDERWLLLAFPNLFELFFLFKLLAERFAPAMKLTPATLSLWLGILLVPKLAQEWALHYERVLDDYVLKDVLLAWRNTITGWFR